MIEAYSQVRHIYTDGRPLPEDPDEKFFGTSIGRWDNGTLVAETVGFSPQTELSANVPHSGKMKIVTKNVNGFSVDLYNLLAVEMKDSADDAGI